MSELPERALGRRGQFQLNLVLQYRRYSVDSKPSGARSLPFDALGQLASDDQSRA